MLREYLVQVRRFSTPARFFLAAQFLYGIGISTVWVLRNLYLRSVGFDELFIGRTLSAQACGMVAVLLLLTGFMDRSRAKGFLVAGVLLLSGGLSGVALVADAHPYVVVGLCFMTGVGMALLEVSTAPFFTRHSTAAERPYLFGVGTALSPLAGLVATLGIKAGAMGWGEDRWGYRNLMLSGAAAAAMSVLALALIREAAVDAPSGRGDRLDWRQAVRFCVPEAVFGLGIGLTIPFINLYFHRRFSVPAGTIGLYYAGAQALVMVAFLAAPVVARRFGAVPTIVALELTSIPFFLVLALTTSLPAAVAAFLLRHACMNMIHPVSAHFAMTVAHPRQRARLNGLRQISNKGAWVVAAALGGWLIQRAPLLVDGFTTTMLATIVMYVAGSALYWWFFRGEPAGRVPVPAPEPTMGS